MPAAVGNKQARIIALLRRPEGATIAELMGATGWLSHSVRGALSGLLKRKLGLVVQSSIKPQRGRVYRLDAEPAPAQDVVPGPEQSVVPQPAFLLQVPCRSRPTAPCCKGALNHLRVRRFYCRNSRCTRRTFAERLPELVMPHARRTCRPATAQG